MWAFIAFRLVCVIFDGQQVHGVVGELSFAVLGPRCGAVPVCVRQGDDVVDVYVRGLSVRYAGVGADPSAP